MAVTLRFLLPLAFPLKKTGLEQAALCNSGFLVRKPTAVSGSPGLICKLPCVTPSYHPSVAQFTSPQQRRVHGSDHKNLAVPSLYFFFNIIKAGRGQFFPHLHLEHSNWKI